MASGVPDSRSFVADFVRVFGSRGDKENYGYWKTMSASQVDPYRKYRRSHCTAEHAAKVVVSPTIAPVRDATNAKTSRALKLAKSLRSNSQPKNAWASASDPKVPWHP